MKASEVLTCAVCHGEFADGLLTTEGHCCGSEPCKAEVHRREIARQCEARSQRADELPSQIPCDKLPWFCYRLAVHLLDHLSPADFQRFQRDNPLMLFPGQLSKVLLDRLIDCLPPAEAYAKSELLSAAVRAGLVTRL